jgi:hypothetical protein
MGVIAEALRSWLPNAEGGMQSSVTSCEVAGGRIGNGGGSSLGFSGFALLIANAPLLRTHLSPPPDVCDSSHQASHYHILRLQARGCSSGSALGCLQSRGSSVLNSENALYNLVQNLLSSLSLPKILRTKMLKTIILLDVLLRFLPLAIKRRETV